MSRSHYEGQCKAFYRKAYAECDDAGRLVLQNLRKNSCPCGDRDGREYDAAYDAENLKVLERKHVVLFLCDSLARFMQSLRASCPGFEF